MSRRRNKTNRVGAAVGMNYYKQHAKAKKKETPADATARESK